MERIYLSKASRIFFYIFFVIIFLSMTAAYYRYMVLEEYPIFLDEDTQRALDEGHLDLSSSS